MINQYNSKHSQPLTPDQIEDVFHNIVLDGLAPEVRQFLSTYLVPQELKDKYLSIAAIDINIDTIKVLLEEKANPTVNGYNAILNAARNERKDVIELILSFPYSIPYEILLIINACIGNASKVDELVNMESDINYNNRKAFLSAIKNNHIEVIKIFIQHGIDIHFNNDEPLKIANSYERKEIINLLANS